MRAQWEALHKNLWRSVRNSKSEKQFKGASTGEAELARFNNPESLVAFLASKQGGLDEKDRIYAVLVRAVQRRSTWRALASSLLWLGLWPGLDAIYNRRTRYFLGRPDELVSEISFIFTTTVERVALSKTTRLAATLVRNVERDARTISMQNSAQRQDFCDISSDHLIKTEPSLQSETLFDSRRLPVDATDGRALRNWLSEIVYSDADLVMGVVLYGFDFYELSEELGMGYETARKRFARAVRRIRSVLERSDAGCPRSKGEALCPSCGPTKPRPSDPRELFSKNRHEASPKSPPKPAFTQCERFEERQTEEQEPPPTATSPVPVFRPDRFVSHVRNGAGGKPMTRNKEQMQAIAKALEELDRNGFWEDRPHVTPGEYEPLPGLYRRWEIEMALLPGVDLRIEEAGRTEDGADLYEVYTRKAS